MSTNFLLYGATGFVGRIAAATAVQQGLRPVIAGRNAAALESQAAELGVEFRAFRLEDYQAIRAALRDLPVVLHCAGPYIHTAQPMATACLQTGTHYLDLTGEIPVYAGLAARNVEARERGVMLLPGVGFDVVPTDCLALYLKQRLPSATQLTLAFQTRGPAGLPPGTQRTVLELIPFGDRVRRQGRLERPGKLPRSRMVDFGRGPVEVTRLTWGDVFMAYHSTGIPNIETFAVLPQAVRTQMAVTAYLRPLFSLAPLRALLARGIRPGPNEEQRARSSTAVWGEVRDEHGNHAAARLYGPEAAVIWTVQTALATVRKVLAGQAPPGFQTPARAYGPDFVLEGEGVTREDVV
jgi:short subunit dehydrogenase-like uncharacterized protein